MNRRTELLIERNKSRKENTQDYILSRISKAKNDCWIWTGTIGSDGYGKAKRDGKTVRAHRLSYAFYKGDIPANTCVCHRCDTPLCVNPDHLWIGSHIENELDKTQKGRRSPSPSVSHPERLPKGESHHKAKLLDGTVEVIYQMGVQNMTAEQIKESLELEVHPSSINRIISGKGWSHLRLSERYGDPLPQNIGDRNPSSKLTAQAVLEIRSSSNSLKELAQKYNVSESNIHCILKRKTWTHV